MTDHTALLLMSADEARAVNFDLDRQLLEVAAAVGEGELPCDADDGEWTLAENLAHIGEFPGFFAGELARWFADRSTPLGRTHEDERRLAAISAAGRWSKEELLDGMRTAFAALATALEPLRDDDLDALTNNRKYGPEPLRAFLDRYVIGHKQAHVEQLSRTIRLVRDRRGTTTA